MQEFVARRTVVMRRIHLAAFCAVGLSAAANLSAQDGIRTPAPPHEPAHDTKVLIGCLAAGANGATFKLTNAVPKDQASTAPAGTSGTAAQYELRSESRIEVGGPPPPDLKPFVGKQVEITARPTEASPPSAPEKPTATTGSPEPSTARPDEARVETLTVTAVRQVAASCQ
jgi:hypothetical protein